jgi:hypothetical protein
MHEVSDTMVESDETLLLRPKGKGGRLERAIDNPLGMGEVGPIEQYAV